MIDRQEVLRLVRESDLLGEEIAQEVGCSGARIVQIVRSETGMSPTEYRRAHGWIGTGTASTRGRMVSPKRVQMVLKLHSLGYTDGEIRAATGVDRGIISFIRKKKSLPQNAWVRSKLPAEEIARRYKEGENTLQLQDAYGVSERLIRRVLDEQGVKRRPRFGRS